jgi:hypothetical protein
VLNDATIPCLRCRVVCGGANNQLAEARHDATLAIRGIVFAPDYLANAGGVVDFHQETIDDQSDAVLASVARIGDITRSVLRYTARRHPIERRGCHRSGADHPAGVASQHQGAAPPAFKERWTGCVAGRPVPPVGGVISAVVADRHSGHALKHLHDR